MPGLTKDAAHSVDRGPSAGNSTTDQAAPAAPYQGFFPVNLEHADQLAEIAAALAALRRQAGRDPAET